MGSDNPQILSLLSQQLQNELQYERYKHVLDRVLFLKRLIEQEELSTQQGQVLQKISMAVVVDDTVFCAGGLAEACFFILQGSLRYTQVERPTVLLQNAGAAAEMTLWTEWTFVGDLVSTSFSKIAAIQVDDFERCIVSSPELQHEAHGYAAEYIEALNELELLSDLWRFGHRHSLRDFVKHRTGRPSILQRGLKLVPKRWVSWRSWLWPSRVAPEKSPSRTLHIAAERVSDVAFMEQACQQIRHSRRFLKWTYAHGYFMRCDEAKKKLFEFHQAQLEGTLERLSDLMENTSWGSFMGEEVISFQPFYDLRTRVISLTSVVRDFFAKLQEALQTEQFTPT
eukprot:g24301.t1